MKIISKEEEQAHYNATIKGGAIGGLLGLGIGATGIALASRRFHAFRQLTLPFRVFLASSSATFLAIVSADRASKDYEVSRHAEQQKYTNKQQSLQEQIAAGKSTSERAKDWLSHNRYPLLFGAWVASMGGSFYLVNRNAYLTGAQKLVQARVYAQGLSVALLVGSFALEGGDALSGKGRWETVKVLDPDDPTHKHLIDKRIHHERYAGEDQWMDMVAAEEAKLKEREARRKKQTLENQSKAEHEASDEKSSKQENEKEANKEENKKENNKKEGNKEESKKDSGKGKA